MTAFAVTWDYRCPFARNAHEHLLTAMEAGADWDVTFSAFSLDQSHVEEGATPVWDEPDRYPALVVNEVGIVVRDRLPGRFRAVHQALFEARHDRTLDIRQRDVLAGVLAEQDVDASAVFSEIDDGWPLETYRKEHSAAVEEYQVFGVPTFIAGGRAVFVRLLDRPRGDAERATTTITRIVDMLDWAELNEFKATSLPF